MRGQWPARRRIRLESCTLLVVFANLAFVVDSSASEILKISEVNGGSRVQRMVP
jgi:hypothetical protein